MFLLLLLLPGFSEIMPDPIGADNNLEFVELYWNETNNTLDLFGDAKSNDTLALLQESNSSYILIVEEGFDYSELNCTIYSAGATIGNNLGNTEDSLWFSSNNTIINTTYSISGCAAGEGCSLSWNASWVPTTPTPCEPNEFPEEECTLNLTILVDELFSIGETITYKPKLAPKPDNFTLLYWWEDLYGDIVRDVQATTNTNEKRYTPKQPGNERDFALLAKMSIEACNETLIAEELVVVKGVAPEEKECPVVTCSSGGTVVTTPEKPRTPVLVATAPELIDADEAFTVTATLFNDQYTTKKYNVSAFAYRGSKNFTPRTHKEVELSSFSQTGISFTLELEPGEYSLKVKAYREGRKTPFEERRTITVLPRPVTESVNLTAKPEPPIEEPLVQEIEPVNTLTPITGAVVEANDQKSYWWVSLLIAGGLYWVSRRRTADDAA